MAIGIAILILMLLWCLLGGRVRLLQGFGRRFKQTRPSAQPLLNQVHQQTQQRLFRLLNGDRKGAERLLQSAHLRTPGESEQWYWEKVISDLERDRRLR